VKIYSGDTIRVIVLKKKNNWHHVKKVIARLYPNQEFKYEVKNASTGEFSGVRNSKAWNRVLEESTNGVIRLYLRPKTSVDSLSTSWLSYLNDAVAIMDSKTHLVYVNDAASKLFGLSEHHSSKRGASTSLPATDLASLVTCEINGEQGRKFSVFEGISMMKLKVVAAAGAPASGGEEKKPVNVRVSMSKAHDGNYIGMFIPM
jgi:hypothetical protein